MAGGSINFSSTTPAAPSGSVNVKFQYDASGNVSAYATQSALSLVSSVFGRAGAVVAANGDYTAAQITNAIDATKTYANPPWITSIDWSKITGTAPPATVSALQTPWVTNHNAAGFSLSNVPAISGNGNISVAAGGPGNLNLLTNALTRLRIDSGGSMYVYPRDSDGGSALWLSNGSITNYLFTDPVSSGIFINSHTQLVLYSGDKARITLDGSGSLLMNPSDGDNWTHITSNANASHGFALQTAGITRLIGDSFDVWTNVSATNRQRLVIDSAGHVTINAPDTYGTSALYSAGVIESAVSLGYTCNLSYNGSSWTYRANGAGLQIRTDPSAGYISVAPAGTAGATAGLNQMMQFAFAGDQPVTMINSYPIFNLNTPGSAPESLMAVYNLMIAWTSNTQLTFRVKGSDGVIRQGSIALA